MGILLTTTLDAIRRAASAQRSFDNLCEPEPADDSGETCSVMLGPLSVLASYSVDGEEITVASVTIQGQEIEALWFDAETLKVWATEIAASRAQDERIARDAAAYEAWERTQ